jgi:hypothetical protein
VSRLPTRSDHYRFCTVEGWQEVRNARGQRVRHHETYELELPDGRVLRTRISRPVNRHTYGEQLWKHILTDQLMVTEDVFWECVDDGVRPPRTAQKHTPPADAIPASLVYQLLHEVGLDEQAVARMTRDEAIARMQQHWSQPASGA